MILLFASGLAVMVLASIAPARREPVSLSFVGITNLDGFGPAPVFRIQNNLDREVRFDRPNSAVMRHKLMAHEERLQPFWFPLEATKGPWRIKVDVDVRQSMSRVQYYANRLRRLLGLKIPWPIVRVESPEIPTVNPELLAPKEPLPPTNGNVPPLPPILKPVE